MPGCRSVLSFRTAFRANGSLDLLTVISKLKMLHFDPSSFSIVMISLQHSSNSAESARTRLVPL